MKTGQGLIIAAVIIAAGAIAFASGMWLAGGDDKERKLCDQYVDVLLHSQDAAEVERAGWLTYDLNCAITRRIKP